MAMHHRRYTMVVFPRRSTTNIICPNLYDKSDKLPDEHAETNPAGSERGFENRERYRTSFF